MKNKIFLPIALAGILAGCSGYNSQYSCSGMPEGIKCKSLGSVYSESFNGSGSGAVENAGAAPEKTSPASKTSKTENAANGTVTKEDIVRSLGQNFLGMPIRVQPEIMRLWISPWIDMEGDLHDAGYVYVEVDKSRWALGDNLERIDYGDGGKVIYPKVPKKPAVEQQNKSGQSEKNSTGSTGSNASFPKINTKGGK